MPCKCGSWDPSKQCGKEQCKCNTLAISVVRCSVAPKMAVWLKVQCKCGTPASSVVEGAVWWLLAQPRLSSAITESDSETRRGGEGGG